MQNKYELKFEVKYSVVVKVCSNIQTMQTLEITKIMAVNGELTLIPPISSHTIWLISCMAKLRLLA